ncbi:MAG TPA: shikimate dehydrogenase [Steroidobacteraceae bacterium]|nr:shikimate dehydrogenase [Steroidobacteraceae bacterium]
MSEPDRYAVIGHPIAHSRSPWIHAEFARATGQSMLYTAIDATPAALGPVLRSFFDGGGRGLNVTAPHKQAVLAMMTSLSERARVAGAVNTIARQSSGALFGDNTDGIGFMRDLMVNLAVPVQDRRVLLLGAGGAARGLLGPLLAARPAELVIANRDLGRALELAERFAAAGPLRACGFEGLAAPALEPFDLIINATAASLHAQLPPLPEGLIGPACACYDLAYAASATAFVHWARERGAALACSGGGMLVEQAAEAFLLWRGVRPETASVRARLPA